MRAASYKLGVREGIKLGAFCPKMPLLQGDVCCKNGTALQPPAFQQHCRGNRGLEAPPCC